MSKEEIYNAIESLSKSQGFYCRVLQSVQENPEVLDKLEELKFKDIVDLVLYLEG